ncbi:MAG: hypothetical protein P9M06_07905 [Candidatus Saelkia tenebricola]|nr:hypothetical protein [Candidatus Saelkia tenebricola]
MITRNIFNKIVISILLSVLCFTSSNINILEIDNPTLRRSKEKTLNTETLLKSGLTDEQISSALINHLWQSWDEIIPSLEYVAANIEQLYQEQPAILYAFLTSIITDIRTGVTPSIAVDLETAYNNIDKIVQLWEIENSFQEFILNLDQRNEGSDYFTRYLVVSLCKLFPAKIDVDRFKSRYEALIANGLAEFQYVDERGALDQKHGVTYLSRLVSVAEAIEEFRRLEDDNCFVPRGITIFNPGTGPEAQATIEQLREMDFHIRIVETDYLPDVSSLPEENDWRGNETEIMLNLLQRPYNVGNTGQLEHCCNYWRSQVEDEIEFPFDEILKSIYTDFRSLEGTTTAVEIRQKLHQIINNPEISLNTRIETMAFDRVLSSFAKNIMITFSDSSISFNQATGEMQGITPYTYERLVSAINASLTSLILDRYISHRFWLPADDQSYLDNLTLMHIDPQRTYGPTIDISSGQLVLRDLSLTEAEILLYEINYLTAAITEIKDSLRGEPKDGSLPSTPYVEFVNAKFQAFQEIYQSIVDRRTSTFPTLGFLRAHVEDTNIALSCLRQIEALVDQLKEVLQVDKPELFYSDEETIRSIQDIANNYLLSEVPKPWQLEKVSQDIASEADGLIVLSVIDYNQTHDIIVTARKTESRRMKMYYILTAKDSWRGLPVDREPLMTASNWNGEMFSQGPVLVTQYTQYNRGEIDASGRFIINSTPDTRMINIYNLTKAAGVICDRGGLTAHFIGVLRDMGIAGLAATDFPVSTTLSTNMPIILRPTSRGVGIYPMRYSFREGDIAYNYIAIDISNKGNSPIYH